MKIAVICPGFGVYPRGIETVVYEVFCRLAVKHTELEITIYCGAEKYNSTLPPNIRLRKIKLPSYDNFFAKIFARFLRKMKCPAHELYDFSFFVFAVFLLPHLLLKRYELIFNNGGLFSAYICNLARFVSGVKYIHSGHAGINKLEQKLASLKPDVYIASSAPAQKWISEIVPYLNTIVIPNGIDSSVFFPARVMASDLGLHCEMRRPVYLFVGALTRQKQPDALLKAFIANNTGSLIIAGDGVLREEIEKISEQYKLDKSQFLKIQNIDYAALPKYFNYCDYFVLPSQNETFGIVYIMAAACNKPALAENSEIQKWMLGDAAVYCDYSKDNDIAAKMIEITKINFAEKPLHCSEKFQWNVIVEQYSKIIFEK